MTTERSLIQASLAEIMPEHIGLRVNMYEIIMFQLKLGQKQEAEAYFRHFHMEGKGLKILVSVDFCSDNG